MNRRKRGNKENPNRTFRHPALISSQQVNKPSHLLHIQPFLPPFILPFAFLLTRRNLHFDPVDPLRETTLVDMRPLPRIGMELRVALIEPGAIERDEHFVRTAHGELFGDGRGDLEVVMGWWQGDGGALL